MVNTRVCSYFAFVVLVVFLLSFSNAQEKRVEPANSYTVYCEKNNSYGYECEGEQYYPQQCDDDDCWCVHLLTGEQYVGTRGPKSLTHGNQACYEVLRFSFLVRINLADKSLTSGRKMFSKFKAPFAEYLKSHFRYLSYAAVSYNFTNRTNILKGVAQFDFLLNIMGYMFRHGDKYLTNGFEIIDFVKSLGNVTLNLNDSLTVRKLVVLNDTTPLCKVYQCAFELRESQPRGVKPAGTTTGSIPNTSTTSTTTARTTRRYTSTSTSTSTTTTTTTTTTTAPPPEDEDDDALDPEDEDDDAPDPEYVDQDRPEAKGDELLDRAETSAPLVMMTSAVNTGLISNPGVLVLLLSSVLLIALLGTVAALYWARAHVAARTLDLDSRTRCSLVRTDPCERGDGTIIWSSENETAHGRYQFGAVRKIDREFFA